MRGSQYPGAIPSGRMVASNSRLPPSNRRSRPTNQPGRPARAPGRDDGRISHSAGRGGPGARRGRGSQSGALPPAGGELPRHHRRGGPGRPGDLREPQRGGGPGLRARGADRHQHIPARPPGGPGPGAGALPDVGRVGHLPRAAQGRQLALDRGLEPRLCQRRRGKAQGADRPRYHRTQAGGGHAPAHGAPAAAGAEAVAARHIDRRHRPRFQQHPDDDPRQRRTRAADAGAGGAGTRESGADPRREQPGAGDGPAAPRLWPRDAGRVPGDAAQPDDPRGGRVPAAAPALGGPDRARPWPRTGA